MPSDLAWPKHILAVQNTLAAGSTQEILENTLLLTQERVRNLERELEWVRGEREEEQTAVAHERRETAGRIRELEAAGNRMKSARKDDVKRVSRERAQALERCKVKLCWPLTTHAQNDLQQIIAASRLQVQPNKAGCRIPNKNPVMSCYGCAGNMPADQMRCIFKAARAGLQLSLTAGNC